MIIGLDYRPALLSRTGIGRVARELAPALARREEVAQVRLFASSLAPAALAPPPLPPRCRLHRLPLPGRLLPALARLGAGADTLCGGCDLFLWTDFVFPPVRGRAAMVLHDLAFMVDRKWHGERSNELEQRTRAAAERSALVLVPSPQVKEQVARLLPAAAARTRLLPWGADHVAPSPATGDFDPDLFVAPGTVEPRKDQATLLAAFDLLRCQRPQARLVVAGRRGWADPAVAAELERRSVDPASGVRWEQGLEDGELFALIARAAALVYPSRYEGFGLPVAEALALGVPPIVAAGTACAWVAGPVGATFPPGDAAALCAAMATPLDRRPCRARARRFTWKRTARRLAALLQEEADR